MQNQHQYGNGKPPRSDAQLWRQIKSFELDDDDSQLTFTDRLARENGWTHQYSIRAIEEYKKFIYLVCISDKAITPSDEVDQVWHLHLLYTYSYWKELCGNILNREIHHGPTKGGMAETLKYGDCYTRTLDMYKKVFNEEAPADIWPCQEIRFNKTNFQRVSLNDNWVIRKPFR